MEDLLCGLCKSYSQFNYHSKRLRELDRDITQFNEIFSAFLFGLQLNSECLEIRQLPPVASSSPVPNGASKPAATAIASEVKMGHSSLKESHPSQANATHVAKQPTGAKKTASKLKKESTSSIVKKMILGLPLHMRDSKHVGEVEMLVKFLQNKPEGHYVNDIFASCQVDKHTAMQILNLLVKSGDILKVSRKGLLYQLNPEKYLL